MSVVPFRRPVDVVVRDGDVFQFERPRRRDLVKALDNARIYVSVFESALALCDLDGQAFLPFSLEDLRNLRLTAVSVIETADHFLSIDERLSQ